MQELLILAFVLYCLIDLSAQDDWGSIYVLGPCDDYIQEISDLKSQISALQGNVNTSQGQISMLQNQVTALQQGLTVDTTTSFILKNQGNGGCLQVQGANPNNLALFELVPCDPSQPLQMMTMHQPEGYITVQPSTKCLTVYAGNYANGNRIDQFDCWSAANQRWEFIESSGTQTFQLKVVGRNSCVNADPTGVLITTCDATTTGTTPSTQVWQKLQTQPTVGKLVNALDPSGRCLQSYVATTTGNVGLKLVDGTCPEIQFSMTTQFMFEQKILFLPLTSNQYLTVIGGMLSSGSVVRLLPNMNILNQQWKIILSTTSPWFQIQNPASGRCLAARNLGTFIALWDCVVNYDASSGQFWNFI